MSVAVRAEADERDSQSQQTQEKCHHWRILGEIISKVGHRLQETHNQTPHSPVFVKRKVTSVTKVFIAFDYSTFFSFFFAVLVGQFHQDTDHLYFRRIE